MGVSVTASERSLSNVQQELSTHASASRAILTHLCQRLSQLENAVQGMRFEMKNLRSDTSEQAEGVKQDVVQVKSRMESMSTQLDDYGSVMDLFQTEIKSHKSDISWISTSIKEDHQRVNKVMTKVDSQHDLMQTKFLELKSEMQANSKVVMSIQEAQEMMKKELDAISVPREEYTLHTDMSKLPLEKHIHRFETGSRRSEYLSGPFTDLQPFTVPDDMREKMEKRIRSQNKQKRNNEERAATKELEDAYRRILLTSSDVRLSELRLQMDRCQQEVQRAFQYIRTSNLQLYSCCETKVEKADVSTLQSEMKLLRNRLRDVETTARFYRGSNQVQNDGSAVKEDVSLGITSSGQAQTSPTKHWSGNVLVEMPPTDFMGLTSNQVPGLRVSLLELSKNLSLAQRRWKQKHTDGKNPFVHAHVKKLISMINNAYKAAIENPVDLQKLSMLSYNVARVLSSDFSAQVLAGMGGRTEDFLSHLSTYAASGTISSLCDYAAKFGELVTKQEEAEDKISKLSVQEDRGVQKLVQDVSELDKKHRDLELLVHHISLTSATPMTPLLTSTPTAEDPKEAFSTAPEEKPTMCSVSDHALGEITRKLETLQKQLASMKTEYVTQASLSKLIYCLEPRPQSLLGQLDPIVGHRFTSVAKAETPTRRLRSSKKNVRTGLNEKEGSRKAPLEPLKIHQIRKDSLQMARTEGSERVQDDQIFMTPAMVKVQISSSSSPPPDTTL